MHSLNGGCELDARRLLELLGNREGESLVCVGRECRCHRVRLLPRVRPVPYNDSDGLLAVEEACVPGGGALRQEVEERAMNNILLVVPRSTSRAVLLPLWEWLLRTMRRRVPRLLHRVRHAPSLRQMPSGRAPVLWLLNTRGPIHPPCATRGTCARRTRGRNLHSTTSKNCTGHELASSRCFF